VSLKVKAGDVSTVLSYVASRFHREIEPLQQAQSAGYSYRIISDSNVLSNHASGTAVDFNWGEHQQGRTGTFTAAQEAVVRDILAVTGSTVRWGGDYRTTPDEMHFEINVPPGDPGLTRVAASLRGSDAPQGWTSIVSADLDGDGDDEVGYYRRVDGLFQWYEMTATGGLGTRLGSSTLSPTWTSILSADLDGNGDDEVGFYRTSDGTMVWYPMTATGGLGTRLGIGTLSPTWTSILSADLDGNGKDEVGFYRTSDGTMKWYRTTSTGAPGTRLTPAGYALAPGWTQLTGSDVDGDRDDELTFYRTTDGRWVAYEGATDGTLGTRLSSSNLYP
jgi:ethanolamine utilization microcompartment shell protein EutS